MFVREMFVREIFVHEYLAESQSCYPTRIRLQCFKL